MEGSEKKISKELLPVLAVITNTIRRSTYVSKGALPATSLTGLIKVSTLSKMIAHLSHLAKPVIPNSGRAQPLQMASIPWWSVR